MEITYLHEIKIKITKRLSKSENERNRKNKNLIWILSFSRIIQKRRLKILEFTRFDCVFKKHFRILSIKH